ncbi:MAG: ABC transporter ATP-binding protein [Patescibacteria group bacterium]|jgi:putative ABC transport system ATP-binding protein
MRESIIKITDVCVTYNQGKLGETNALKSVSLEIFPEEYVIFFGPSGCGKSTLLYTMAGLETPNSGVVNVAGKDLAKLPARELVQYHRTKLGMIFQAFYLIPSLSVLDNVVLPQMFIRKAPHERKEHAMQVLKRFGIDQFADHLPTELSGGQQQRVAICRAVMNNPDIVFADEPVGNLDSVASEKVMELLYELNSKDKKTVVLVTHDSRYLRFAHRIIYLRDGEIVREVTNTERLQLREEKIKPFVPHALEEFARYYPNLGESELKAKFLSHYLLDLAEERLQERLETLVHKRTVGEVTREQFISRANTPFIEGGVGLYEQTAEHIADNLDAVLEESRFIREHFKNFPESYELLQQGIARLKARLLEHYHGHLTQEQSDRLDQSIKARLEGSLDHRQLKDVLDRPFKDGGVGLHYQTAQDFGRRLEVYLIDYSTEAPKVTDVVQETALQGKIL